MGGHGGLNILPQKKWNVYNRDNRLKVARDEAAYEQRQQDLNEKHNAAEREHRRLALKERARQRHGGAATINLDAVEEEKLNSLEQYPLKHQQQVEKEGAPHTAADPMLLWETVSSGGFLKSAQDDDKDVIKGREPTTNALPSPKPQKREKNVQKKEQKPAHSLAELAWQLDTAEPPQPSGAATIPTSQPEEATLVTTNTISKSLPQKRHINLFEEEEARAKNPEKTAEQRALLSKRGDVKTHTSDARFDESFQLGYGLGGGKGGGPGTAGAAPWYAQLPSSLNATAGGDGGNGDEFSLEDKRKRKRGEPSVMEKLKEQGRAALLAAAAAAAAGGIGNADKEGGEEGGGEEESEMMLLKGVKVIPNVENKDNPTRKKEEKINRHDRGRKEKEKSTSHRKEKEKISQSKEDTWSKLREERMRREQEEQKRQNEAVRSALGTEKGNRRYFSTYGYGK